MSTEVVVKKSYLQVILLAMGHFFNDFYCNFLPILLPILIPKLGLSLTLSGALVMVMSLSANVLQPVFGYFMDKYNFNKIMPLIIPFGAVFICLTNWASNFIVLAVLIGLSGLAVSTFHPMGAGLVSKVAPDGKISTCISIFVAGGSFGFALAPILLVYFMQMYSLDYLPILIIPAIILGILMYSSGLSKARFVNEQVAKNMHFNLAQILQNKPLMLLNISMGLRAWLFTALVTFLPLWAIEKGCDNTLSGWILTIYLCGSVIGGLIGGALNDKIGYKKVILWALIFTLIPTMYFLFAQQIDILMYIALFVGGGLVMAANPGAIVWGQDLLPDNPGMASGMMLGLSFGLGGFGTMLTGSLAESYGLTMALALTAILLVISIVLVYLTPEKRRQ
ncbi:MULTISPECIES: MFS transporter [Megamonas]|jgi:FSR family fosmidomycin resistance protein-like MFS transporter|uniref:Fosmidomycin resistance protein n=2 Tax=Megamonas TaxID=158846 RepID=A0A378NP25_9FIRM|nr:MULTISPECIES: MFS transporter [Megamonas]RGQ81799.1 MFS transporter [Megamonas rupellensis]BDA09221.1 MFS transporter [Megamonas funiformis]STY70154.1 Fosmidomycin resistance protein [Megamonas hypermegale]HJG04035.1 MFS transporter [Megamonas funiformis]